MSIAGCAEEAEEAPPPTAAASPGFDSWQEIRAHFELDPSYVHLAGLFVASHPTPVREAIARYRRAQNSNPALFVEENMADRQEAVRRAAASYMDVRSQDIALTNSTTMGTALAINGLTIRPDQEMITADFDYYSTHESIRYKAERSGASWRRFPLYDDVSRATQDEIIESIRRQISDDTRLLTATWVHSSTGLKMPIRAIADEIADINSSRSSDDQIIFFVDGVHGFGVEQDRVADLGCDVFTAGTHKWLHGPRGTGVLYARREVQNQIAPTIPTFTDGAGWGGRMSPGGFNAFEHHWALDEAFAFHDSIGRERVHQRIHQLARILKEGLSDMDHVTLYTPMDDDLSSGIVCFDVDGMGETEVVSRLLDQSIITSATPYTPSHARFTPGIFNTEDDVSRSLGAVRDLA